ncbi:MAG: hypothetical protein KAX39_01830 [candidate division Zixibacteria bacterium]|nr:hypothetical protein [candidate division Zixibacteria bacterium]
MKIFLLSGDVPQTGTSVHGWQASTRKQTAGGRRSVWSRSLAFRSLGESSKYREGFVAAGFRSC